MATNQGIGLGYIKVVLPPELKGQVTFSPFSKKEDADKKKYRGIADIDFPLKSDFPDAEVLLEVYITETEAKKPDLKIFAYKQEKTPNWEPLGIEKTRDDEGRNFIQAKLKAGDPPIAVG